MSSRDLAKWPSLTHLISVEELKMANLLVETFEGSIEGFSDWSIRRDDSTDVYKSTNPSIIDEFW